MQDSTVASEKSIDGGVKKLSAVVRWEGAYGDAKLRASVREKVCESTGSARFVFEWKIPVKMRVIIDNNKIVSKTRYTDNGRGPQITMYQIKDGARR